MPMLTWPKKDPSDVLDYGIDGWLAHIGGGDKVASATWSVTPAGLTLGDSAVSEDGDETSVWVSEGVAGATYTVTCRAITEQGRQIDRSARLFVTER